MDIYGSLHPDAQEHAEKIIARNAETRSWLRKSFASATPVNLTTEEGIVLSEGIKFDFNQTRIIEMMKMVVRSLIYDKTGEILATDCPVYAERIPWNQGAQFLQIIGGYRMGDPIIKANIVVWWGEMPIEKTSEVDSFWVVCFNDAVVFLLASGDWATRIQLKRTEFEMKPDSDNIDSREYVLPRNADGQYIIP